MRLYPCGNFFLSLPDDHKLPEIQKTHALYDRSYASILRALSGWRPSGAIVDIGANVGDTAAFIRTHIGNPIVCVEGGNNFVTHLRHNARIIDDHNIHILDRFVAPDSKAHLPAAYVEKDGTGYLHLEGEGRVNFITTGDLLSFARDLGQGEIALLKSDTDGMDGLIIRDVINQDPDFAIHFECDYMVTQSLGRPDLWNSIFEDLERLGWSSIIFDNCGLPFMFMDKTSSSIIDNIQGWIHLQRQLGVVRTHYIDVFSFPPTARAVYDAAKSCIGDSFLQPYRY